MNTVNKVEKSLINTGFFMFTELFTKVFTELFTVYGNGISSVVGV